MHEQGARRSRNLKRCSVISLPKLKCFVTFLLKSYGQICFHFCQQDAANTEFTAKCQQWVLAMLEFAMLELAMLEFAMLELAMLEFAMLELAMLEHAVLELAMLEHAVLELAMLEHAGWICSRSRAQPSNLTRFTLFPDKLT